MDRHYLVVCDRLKESECKGFFYSDSSILLSKYPAQVIVKYKYYQQDYDNQADLLGNLPLLDAERFSHDSLKEEEEEMSTIKDRDRKEVYYAQIDTYYCHKEKKI